MTLSITQINNRFVVETSNGKLHILNRKSLIWNLKRVFNIKGQDGRDIMTNLDSNGYIEVYMDEAA